MNLIEFGTISHIKKGKKPLRQIDKPQDGYRPYVDIEAFETGNIKMYTDGEKCLPCKAGDILIVCDGSRSGFVGKAIDGYVGSTLAIISADGMSQEYLYYFLQGKYALLNTKKKGTGTPHLDANILNQQKLVVPSLEEQKRVVARIEELFSELDNGVETLKKTKQQLAVYRQAVLKEAFDCVSFKSDTRLIKDVCDDIKVGIVIKPAQYYTNEAEGIKAFRSANVREFHINNTDWVYLSKEGHRCNLRSEIHKGDVLIVRSGYPGTSCVVTDEYNGCNAIDILIAVPNTDLVTSEYLCAFTNSPYGRKLVSEKKRGVAQAHLNVGGYSQMKIPVPDISLQYQVVEKIEADLSRCDNIEKTVDIALQQAEAMRQSILKKAFEGKL